jgi:hypothetical protein
MILDAVQQGTMSAQQAQLHLDQQRVVSAGIVASAQLMNLVQAQAIVNAAMTVLVAALNTAIGAIKFV